MGSGLQPDGKARHVAATAGMRFGIDDLRQVRRMTAQWAERAGMLPEQADGFVIAVNEIATNAVRYGSPAARLLLRVAGPAQAEVRDSGCWRPAAGPASGNGRSGGRGLALARLVRGEVGSGPGPGALR